MMRWRNIRWRQSRTIRTGFVVLLVAGTLVGNYADSIPIVKLAFQGWSERLDGKPTSGISETVDDIRRDVRDAMREMGRTGVAYLYLPDGRLTSYRRSLFLALNWEMMPGRVTYDGVEGIGKTDIVVAPSMAILPQSLLNGYRRFRDVGDWEVWIVRTGARIETDAPDGNTWKDCRSVSVWRELAGLSPIFLLFLLSLFRSDSIRFALSLLLFSLIVFLPFAAGRCPSVTWVWIGAGISAVTSLVVSRLGKPQRETCRTLPFFLLVFGFFTLSFLALSHTFPTPNGLGVYGGKAKLLYLSQGIPPGFFSDSAYVLLQPFYPPGLTVLTLGAYTVSGICGEWITQLLPVVCFCGLIWLLLAHSSRKSAVWIALLLSIPEALRMTSCFYAEPMLALFFFAGIDWIERGRNVHTRRIGWILAGASGWVKMEGVLFFFSLWLSVRLVKGKERAGICELIPGFLLPAAWYLPVLASGGYPPDYAMPWQPDLAKAGTAVIETARLAFALPWRFAFVFPVFFAAYLFRRREEKMRICAWFLLFCVVGFVAVFSWSRAYEFSWHLRSLERLLWIPAIFTIRMFSDEGFDCSSPLNVHVESRDTAIHKVIPKPVTRGS